MAKTLQDDHITFLAQHVLGELNKMGLVKDAQVNATSTRFVADRIDDYLTSQGLKLARKEVQP